MKTMKLLNGYHYKIAKLYTLNIAYYTHKYNSIAQNFLTGLLLTVNENHIKYSLRYGIKAINKFNGPFERDDF